jgi:hypothetical protein
MQFVNFQFIQIEEPLLTTVERICYCFTMSAEIWYPRRIVDFYKRLGNILLPSL